jgi:tetratricopeptide (TPR) repeat protein
VSENLPDFDVLWDYDDPEGTAEKFFALLPGPDERAWQAAFRSQIARAVGLQGNFMGAIAVLDEAEKYLEAGPSVARVRCLLERGRLHNTFGKPDLARPLFLAAFEEARQLGADFFAVDAAHMLAIIETPEGPFEWSNRAIQMAQASADPKARNWRGSLLNNLGWAYHDLGRYDEALETFRQALAAREEKGPGPQVRIARWCVARTLRSLGRHEEALSLLEGIFKERAGLGEEDGFVSEDLGENLLALGREAQARPHFSRAYALLSQNDYLAKNESQRIERLKELGG